MSPFNSSSDLSSAIKIEGEKINVTFNQGIPQTGQGTVSWNVPSPVAGCDTRSSLNSAYCGIVITLSNSASTANQAPVDGTRYSADPTADSDIHSGDTINGALVIGAFYEGELKGQGEDLTVDLVVSDVNPDEFYFVTVYAVDCQGRYHTDGIRAYSDDFGNIPQPDQPAQTSVTFGTQNQGVMPTDGTDLIPGQIYNFEFDLNTNFPSDSPESNRVVVEIDGADAQTYEDLVNVINDELADLDNPFRSPVPPNSGSLLWDETTKELSIFDGISYGVLPDAIIGDSTDPTNLIDGEDYWFDLTNMIFNRRNSLNVADNGWDALETIIHPTDPTMPICDELWFNGTAGYKWSGNIWCELQYFEDLVDPSLRKIGVCGQYWYNTISSTLFEINVDTQEWEESYAVVLPIAPSNIPAGFFWFDETTHVIRERIEISPNVLEWVPRLELTAAIGNVFPTLEVVPVGATIGFVWYNEADDRMFVYDGSVFIELTDSQFVSWPLDPSDVESCSLWWNDLATVDELRQWNVLTNTWDLVVEFANTEIDPLNPPEIEECAIWNDLETNTIKVWNGNAFEDADYIDYPTDPTTLDAGGLDTAWLDTSNNQWNLYISGDPLPPAWEQLNPITRQDDPSMPSVGQYWFDDENDILYQRSLVGEWSPIQFTTRPVMNNIGDLWFDINEDQLKEWDGRDWVPTQSRIQANLDGRGNLTFATRETGSCVSLLILVPGFSQATENDPNITHSANGHAGGFGRTYTDNPFELPRFLETSLPDDGFLFDALPDARVQPPQVGSDGLRSEPSYAQIGVGTDGSPDERRELMHRIRVQLGYPTIDVELTEEQISLAISRAFDSLRKRSDIAYRREFYMLDTRPGVQRYALTNRKANFHKIVNIMGAHRRSGVFGGGGYSSNSVFDQLFTNQLFQNTTHGGFDLTSLHLSQQYLEQIEIMFATRITFDFYEHDRILNLHQAMHRNERILLDTTIDVTEQDMMKDRFIKSWIERYALAHSRLMLSEIRGKYASLPGAGGGVSLNASDLSAQAREDFAECYAQLDNYIANSSESFGAWDVVIG